MSIRVVVADDEELVRSGIAMILRADGIDVVGEAAHGAEAVDLALALVPDVVVMDLRMPVRDGVSATPELSATDCRVLVLTTLDTDPDVLQAIRAGASGYLLKRAAPTDLVAAIRALAAGEVWLDPAIARAVLTAATSTARTGATGHTLIASLTDREREVLSLMAVGLSNAEIADRLFVGEGTVKTHVSRILAKTASRDRTQAVALAYTSGFMTAR